MRDPDGHLIEVGQYTQLALDHFKEHAGQVYWRIDPRNHNLTE